MVERVEYQVGDGVLVPHDHEAWAQFKNLRKGSIVDIDLYQRRARVFSNSLHMLFKRIAAAKGIRVRNVRGWLAVATGRADTIYLRGKPVPIPWATNPGDMSAAELETFWEDAREIILRDIMPTLAPFDRQEVRELVENMDRHSPVEGQYAGHSTSEKR